MTKPKWAWLIVEGQCGGWLAYCNTCLKLNFDLCHTWPSPSISCFSILWSSNGSRAIMNQTRNWGIELHWFVGKRVILQRPCQGQGKGTSQRGRLVICYLFFRCGGEESDAWLLSPFLFLTSDLSPKYFQRVYAEPQLLRCNFSFDSPLLVAETLSVSQLYKAQRCHYKIMSEQWLIFIKN